MSALSYRPADILRREWWVVAVAFAVAVAIGAVLASGGAATYSAKATVNIDSATVTRNPGLAPPNQVQLAVLSTDSKQAVAKAVGVNAGDLATVRVAVVGSPPTQLTLTYSSKDKDEAARVVKAMQSQALAAVPELSAREIARAQTLVAQTEAALRSMPATGSVSDPAKAADLAYQRWNVGVQLTGFKSNLDSLQQAYTPGPSVTVVRQSAVLSTGKTLAAAGLLGLALGVAIAGVREGLLYRRSRG